MNREEAIKWFEALLHYLAIDEFNEDARAAANLAIEALRGPQPDPITGLVPCGCGGKAVDNDGIEYGYGYKCHKCGIAIMAGSNRDFAKEDWNTAMGWRVDK